MDPSPWTVIVEMARSIGLTFCIATILGLLVIVKNLLLRIRVLERRSSEDRREAEDHRAFTDRALTMIIERVFPPGQGPALRHTPVDNSELNRLLASIAEFAERDRQAAEERAKLPPPRPALDRLLQEDDAETENTPSPNAESR